MSPPRRLTFAVGTTLLTASLSVGAAGCDQGSVEGKTPEDAKAEGKTPEGKTPEGKTPEDKTSDARPEPDGPPPPPEDDGGTPEPIRTANPGPEPVEPPPGSASGASTKELGGSPEGIGAPDEERYVNEGPVPEPELEPEPEPEPDKADPPKHVNVRAPRH